MDVFRDILGMGEIEKPERLRTTRTGDPDELRWIGRLGVPGIFDGEHSFELKPIDSQHTLFVQREVFNGILVPFATRSLDKDSKRGFMEMNVALKKRVEHGL